MQGHNSVVGWDSWVLSAITNELLNNFSLPLRNKNEDNVKLL